MVPTAHSQNVITEPDDLVEERVSEAPALDSLRYAVSSMSQPEVSAAAAEPPWPIPPHTPFREWQRLDRYPNYLAAHIVAGLLENEGVPTIVESIGIFPDTQFSSIWVPKELMHRARWILAFPPPTDNELTFLAIGELHSSEELPRPRMRSSFTWLVVWILVVMLFLGLIAQCGQTSNWCI
jgi:hypothetical protein